MDALDRFTFSQSSLQDYTDCPRRFELRYLQRVAWPAIQAEPARENERHIQRGERFHRLVQQYLVGVPVDRLSRMAGSDPDEHLPVWWENFLESVPEELVGERHTEVSLAAPLGRFQLIAKYDLVLVRPGGRVVIYDWKTSPRRPPRAWLLDRLQTRVYPYLIVTAGAALNKGAPVEPDAVEMIYWYAGRDQPPERLAYSLHKCQQDERFLQALVSEISAHGLSGYPLAASESACRYCVYRSLCARGEQAGQLDGHGYEPAEADGLDFTLEQIGEIGFE